MSTSVRSSLSHEERTAREPRENAIHHVILNRVEQANDTVRLLQLVPHDRRPIKFLPGQWLDVHIPGLPKAGGFTITSTPQDAFPKSDHSDGYVELAIQKSPRNPPAAWLWRPENDILGSHLLVRAGGSFVWPPPCDDVQRLKRAVFIAGGVGVNPLMSILSHLHQLDQMPEEVRFLYTLRQPEPEERILFLSRLEAIAESVTATRFRLQLYLTGGSSPSSPKIEGTPRTTVQHRRVTHSDLIEAISNPEDRAGAVCYICGPPAMTDEFVDVLRHAEGMEEERVLCEKWW
ncbi:MAG: hypothetical protein M1830_010295 [Pleopsidium flavum]|nr:MAG: hypothetical protein M1830_010295 [Pleopsidium flavum]